MEPIPTEGFFFNPHSTRHSISSCFMLKHPGNSVFIKIIFYNLFSIFHNLFYECCVVGIEQECEKEDRAYFLSLLLVPLSPTPIHPPVS